MITRIDFIKSTDILTGTVQYTTNEIYNLTESSDEVATSFDFFYSKPKSIKFSLNAGDSFFNNFMRVQNTINEFSLYFIRAYDEDDNHVFSGLMKRDEFEIDQEQERIAIIAKDFSVLLSSTDNISLNNSERIAGSLNDMETSYTYYIDQSALYYFNNASDLSRSFNYSITRLINLLYEPDNDVKIKDIISIFTSANNHIIRCDLETIKIEDAEYNAGNEVVILPSDINNASDSSLTVSQLDTKIINDNLLKNSTYQKGIKDLINYSYNKFASSIDTKVSCEISYIINSYNLSLNQQISISGKKYVIKSIKDNDGYYDVVLWNAKNAPTNPFVIIGIGTKLFPFATNPPTNNIIGIGTTLNNSDTNDIIGIGTKKNNDSTNDIIGISTTINNESTNDVLGIGTTLNNESTNDVIGIGTKENNSDTNDVIGITDIKS